MRLYRPSLQKMEREFVVAAGYGKASRVIHDLWMPRSESLTVAVLCFQSLCKHVQEST